MSQSQNSNEQAQGNPALLNRAPQLQDKIMDGSDFDALWLAEGGEQDGWMDRFLRADAASSAHVDDNGFSARVMQAVAVQPLPELVAAPRWLLPLAAVFACALTFYLTPSLGFFMHALKGVAAGHWSLPTLLAALVPIAGFGATFASLRE